MEIIHKIYKFFLSDLPIPVDLQLEALQQGIDVAYLLKEFEQGKKPTEGGHYTWS